MWRLALLICWFAVAATAHGQSPKDRFLDDYRKASAACEPRWTKNTELAVNWRTFDESGKVEDEGETTCRANETCLLVKQVSNTGKQPNWHLLRREGIYRISSSNSKPGEYLLGRFTPGSFSPSE